MLEGQTCGNAGKIKVFSFFAGSGLLDLAFENSGFQIDFVNEHFEPFLDAYRYSRTKMSISLPTHGCHSDSIEAFVGEKRAQLSQCLQNSRQDGALVGFIGGPPCPDFSVGGKNRGAAGDNGRLSRIYVDVIINEQPDWFLFENVKGLWRTKKHREFYENLKSRLSEYYDVSDRLINSIEAGAPQDRDRILMFGVHRRHKSCGVVDWDKGLAFKGRSAFDFPWSKSVPFGTLTASNVPNDVPLELTVQHWFDRNDVERHPNQKDCFVPKAGLAKFKVIEEGDDSRKSYKRLHRWRYSPTVAYGNNEVHLHPYKPRRLTVAEALSLQSMPKEFELPPYMTLSNKFKTIGNGVPYLLGLHIAKVVRSRLGEDAIKEVGQLIS